MVAPEAPPKNSPEALQVGRYLEEISRRHEVSLITTPIEKGWVKRDASPNFDSAAVQKIELRLPSHAFCIRMLSTRYANWLRVPDKDFWIKYKSGHILAQNWKRPDVIYSRATPFSAGLLARRLSTGMNVPWVMHLSDPWTDNPYRSIPASRKKIDERYEAVCFDDAAAVTVTSESLRDFYVKKYPLFKRKIEITPNVMPRTKEYSSTHTGSMMRFVYTGALYGARNAGTLIAALDVIRKTNPAALRKIEIIFAGNITEGTRAALLKISDVRVQLVGSMEYEAAFNLAVSADVLLSFEPGGDSELSKMFFPSKLLDYLMTRRPILAITPQGSETARLCQRGYGWCHTPEDALGLASRLLQLIGSWETGEQALKMMMPPPPKELAVTAAAATLDRIFSEISKGSRNT